MTQTNVITLVAKPRKVEPQSHREMDAAWTRPVPMPPPPRQRPSLTLVR